MFSRKTGIRKDNFQHMLFGLKTEKIREENSNCVLVNTGGKKGLYTTGSRNAILCRNCAMNEVFTKNFPLKT